MEQFKSYLASEYQVKDATSIELRFNHTMNIKTDKKSNTPMNIHTIIATIRFYDKDMNMLKSGSVKFVNNELAKVSENKLINIAPKELGNKFMCARKEIIRVIMGEYKDKLDDIRGKIKLLKMFEGKDNEDITVEDEFRGELVQISDKRKEKKTFEM